MSCKPLIARIRNRVVRRLQNSPALYRCFAPLSPSLRPALPTLCGKDTDVVIEGYPRSGNTFAVKAFLYAQEGRTVRIASHHHTQVQLMLARRYGIPAMVLIREPEQAIRSALVRAPHLSARRAVDKYIEFYTDIEGLRDHFVVVDFKRIVSDFGECIGLLNGKFGCRFLCPEFTPEDNRVILNSLRLDVDTNPNCPPSGIAAPSQAKDNAKALLDLSSISEPLEEARGVWRRYITYAEKPLGTGSRADPQEP
jgi:hypothetical protein